MVTTRRYDRCLVDIQLAIDSNYPQTKIQKLNDRQRECIEKLSSIQQTLIEPALCFKQNDKFPDMASTITIDSNKLYGRLVKAKCDIAIGD